MTTPPVSARPSHDFVVHKPPRVEIADGDPVDIESSVPFVRIRGVDLRDVARDDDLRAEA